MATGPAVPDDDVRDRSVAPARGAARRWAVFVVVVVAVLMHALDQTAVATALPAMQADLGSTLAWTSWTITIYGLGQIVVLPMAGALVDRFDARRVFLLGVGCFVAASACCAVSTGIGMLVVARLGQGMAGAVLLPCATGIVADRFGPDRDRAVALFTTIIPIGALLGPVLGGVIVTLTSWRVIFLVNLPVGIAVLAIGAAVVRPSGRRTTGRIDTAGIGLLTLTVLALMLALTGVHGSGGAARVVAPCAIGGSACAAVLLWRHLRRHPDPVIPPRLLAGRHLGALNLMNVLFGAAALGASALIPQYAHDRYGVPVLAAAGLLSARAVVMIATSLVAVGLLRRWGDTPILVVGLVVDAAALALIAAPPLVSTPELWLGAACAVLGAGLGFTAPAASNAGLHLVPDRAAAVSGLRTMFRQIGSILAVTTISALASGSSDPGATTAVAFAVLAAVTGVAVIVSLRVPRHRGRW